MSDTTLKIAASWRDYYEMCKPRVVMMMVLTSLVGMFLAVPGKVPMPVLIRGNVVCAWLTLASFIGYAIIYTGWLKRATPQNIVIGGLSGAMPPLLGWTAVTGSIDPNGLLLVLIIFAWTPPHFWPLAIHRKKDYAKTDIPMLPVTHGDAITKLHTLLYTIILLLVSLMPFLTGMSGLAYLITALVLGAGFLFRSIDLLTTTRPQAAMQTFRYSIFYLLALFMALLIDHYL